MKVLILCSDFTIALSTASCLEQEAHSVIGIGTEASRGITIFSCCEKFYEVKEELFSSSNHLVKIIHKISQTHGCEFVLPIDVKSILFVSRNQSELKTFIKLAHVSNESLIDQLDNKWSFYKLLVKLKLPSPSTLLIDNRNDSIPENFMFPALTKPLQQTGGIGIRYHESCQNLSKEMGTLELPVILQEYISGRDIDCSVYAKEGEIKAWTIQEHVYGGLEFCHNDEVLSICSNILSSISYSGVAHFDLRIDEKTLKVSVLECNPRFWATVNHSMEAGVNFPDLYLRSISKIISGVETIKEETCWVPTKRKSLLKTILLSREKRQCYKPFVNNYLVYLQRNLSAEIFRILYLQNKSIASKWLNFCLKYRYSEKLRIISEDYLLKH